MNHDRTASATSRCSDAPEPADPRIEGGHIEPLEEALVAHLRHQRVFGMVIKHPLVFSICHQPELNAYINAQYRQKTAEVLAAIAAEDWQRLVLLHERPYRLDALVEHSDSMSDETYWGLVGDVWIDSENIGELVDDWDAVLSAERPGRERMMYDSERDTLAALDDVVEVYQGRTSQRDDGWSWTVDRDVAVWFAHRFATLESESAVLATTLVRRDDIVAYFDRRGESEVLVNPKLLHDVHTIVLDAHS